MTFGSGFRHSLETLGIRPEDPPALQTGKLILVMATVLVCAAAMGWTLLYSYLAPQLPLGTALVFQGLLLGNLAFFLKNGNFPLFRLTQLGLFMVLPFVAQWRLGNFINGSGISLWGLLGPIGVILVSGVKKSAPWFIAYLLLTLLTGIWDILQTSLPGHSPVTIPEATRLIFFTLNFACVSSIAYLMLRFAAQEKDRIQARMEDTLHMLEQEQERAEALLLNVLPEPVAKRLKYEDATIADGFAEVSVMFVDIVNFTRVAEGLSPQQVFSMLNRIFSSLDELAESFGLEKIKTIGDAYMVAGGLNGDQGPYTQAMAAMALAIQELLHRDFDINRMHLEVRIGIATGPVVAGVVGKKKFIYDLWGDTVNTASRISSEGSPGNILVDAPTYQRLASQFAFAPAETLELKGKGPVPVYRLLAPATL